MKQLVKQYLDQIIQQSKRKLGENFWKDFKNVK